MSNFKKTLFASGTSASMMIAMSLSTPSFAQEAGGTVADEIVVTGIRGRDENVQQVPISQKVFTAQEIEDAGIETVDDFIGLTPGITISNAQDSGTNFITIRGISQVRNGEAPVAVVIDGVLQTNSRQFDQGLFNVNSIDVVRGPQGARYGRNATGGAILISTKQPGNDREGYVQAGIADGGEFNAEASLSGPLAKDKLFYSVAGRYVNRDGYFDNVILKTKVDPFKEISLRGQLKWLASDNITVDLTAKIVETDGGSLNYTYQPLAIDPATGLGTGFTGAKGANKVSRGFFATNIGSDDRSLSQIALKLKYTTDYGTFKSVTAFDSIKQATTGDQFPYTFAISSNAIFFDGTQTQSVDINTFSQELRFTSPGDKTFRWEVGGYYLDTDRFISTGTGVDLGRGILKITDTPYLGNANNPTSSFIADKNDNTAYAGFFSMEYDFSDKLEIGVAGRYDVDKRTQNVDARQGAYDATGAFLAPIGVPGAINKVKFEQFQPKVTLKYQASDNLNLFASYGEGFRSGQFNQNGVGAVAVSAGFLGITDVLGKEITKTFDLGFKSQFFDDALTLNGTFYSTSIKNAPYFVFIGAVSAQVLVPIDDIDVVGGEIEAVAKLSDNLSVFAGLGIADSEIKTYSVKSAVAGNKAPYVPSSTFNAGVQFNVPISNSIGIVARVDYENRGKQFWDPENSTARSAINLVNLRFGFEDLGGKWSLMGSYDNAFDEVYNSEWVVGGFAHAGLPDIWRLDLKYNF
ncbi:MAG: TonB-dependent receptor [Cocleimonas sp.]